MEWPHPIETKFVLGQFNVSLIPKKKFSTSFHKINTNGASVFVIEKRSDKVVR